jgi:hypothetical protein
MSASLIALRLIALFLLLSGILLLRKPVFGQSVTSHPRRTTLLPTKNLSVLGHSFPIMDTCNSGRDRTPHAKHRGTKHPRKTYLAGELL